MFAWIIGLVVGAPLTMMLFVPLFVVSVGVNIVQYKSKQYYVHELKQCQEQMEREQSKFKQVLMNKDELRAYADEQCKALKDYVDSLPPAPGGGTYLVPDLLDQFYRDKQKE